MRKEKKMRNPLRIFWILLGFLCLGLGTIGIVLPILPTVPFYMATLFCFAKSSERLHTWFIGTDLYKKTSGQFCAEKSHDAWNQMQDHRHGDRSYGHRIYLHEKCACGKNLHSRCVGMPHSVFLPQGKNCGAGGVSSQ